MSDMESRIRERAYHMWEAAGCPPERSDEFWHLARQQIEGEEFPEGEAPPAGQEAIPTADQAPIIDVPGVATGMPVSTAETAESPALETADALAAAAEEAPQRRSRAPARAGRK